MNSIKEFIMNQDVDILAIRDTQLIAEMNVISSMIDCYTKQEMIMEHCSDESVLSEFSIFTEAAVDSGSIKPSLFTILMNAWNKFMKFIKSIPSRIAMIFNKTSIKDLIEMVEDCPDNTMFAMTKRELNSFALLGDILEIFPPVMETILSGKMLTEETRDKYISFVNSLKGRIDGGTNEPKGNDEVKRITADKMLSFLKKLDTDTKLPSSLKKLDKICIQKSIEAGDEMSERIMQSYNACRLILDRCIAIYNQAIIDVTLTQKKIIRTTYRYITKKEKSDFSKSMNDDYDDYNKALKGDRKAPK